MPWNAHHRPLSPNPNIGTRKPTASDVPGEPSRFRSGERRGERHHDLDREHRQHGPPHASGVGVTEEQVHLRDRDLLVRLRCTAFQNDQRNAKTPIANSAIAVMAPTHCAAVEKTTAAVTAVIVKATVPTTSAITITSPARRSVALGRRRCSRLESARPAACSGRHRWFEGYRASRRRGCRRGDGRARRRRTRRAPAGATARPSSLRSASSSSSAANASATAWLSSGSEITNPVSPSATASAAPPESPATCGTPHAAASTNTIPNPSCSSPPHRLRQSIVNTSAQPYSGGRSAFGTRPRKSTGAPSSSASRRGGRRRGRCRRSRAAARGAPDQVGPPPGSPCRNPCVAPSREMLDDDLGVDGEAEVLACREPLAVVERDGTSRGRRRTARR